MNFSEKVRKELIKEPPKKSCCAKSLLFGMLAGAAQNVSNAAEIKLKNLSAAELLKEILSSFYPAEGYSFSTVNENGRKYYRFEIVLKSVLKTLSDIENGKKNIFHAVGFRCASCRVNFMKGLFLAAGTVSNPANGYHLEFDFDGRNAVKTEKLKTFFDDNGFKPNITTRNDKTAFYYKSNSAVADLLYFMGAVKSSFEFANAYIVKDIRNNENRATNCVANNISKSVGASQKQIAAIKLLKAENLIDSLPSELRQTALLRAENDLATLSELALLHDPPISKSGLNHRLNKICRFAYEKSESLSNSKTK